MKLPALDGDQICDRYLCVIGKLIQQNVFFIVEDLFNNDITDTNTSRQKLAQGTELSHQVAELKKRILWRISFGNSMNDITRLWKL